MKKRTLLKILSVLTAAVLFVVSAPTAAFAEVDRMLLPDDMQVVSEKTYAVSPGVEETHIVMNNAAGDRQNLGYALTVDMTENSLIASYNNQDGTTPGMQTVRHQASYAKTKRGYDVVAGVNADIYNMSNGAPTGYLIMEGVNYFNNKGNNPYFAILKDGTPVIREAGESIDDVKEAVGLWCIFVKDGQNMTPRLGAYDQSDQPRTAIGIKADGSVVLYVNDGRLSPESSGISWEETAQMMISLGCVVAGNLDGGGSSTLISKHEGEADFTCRNLPCDSGERKVSSALMVVRNTHPDGVFHHASVMPVNEVYRPGAVVGFSASGVDAAGAPAPLPEGGVFELEDPSYGTISRNGTFVSNGKLGDVTAMYTIDGAVVGAATVHIQTDDPDAIGNGCGFVVDKQTGRLMYSYRGQILKNRWMPVGRDLYYLDANGYVAVGKQSITDKIVPARSEVSDFLFNGQPITLEYTFDDQGRFVKGALYQRGGATYYIYGGFIRFGWYQIDGDWYYFDGVKQPQYYGKMLKGEWSRNSTFNKTDTKTGKLLRGHWDRNSEGSRYLWAKSYASGWQTVEGKLYYFDPDNADLMAVDTAVINGKTFYFNSDGSLRDGQHIDLNNDGVCDICQISVADIGSVFYRVVIRLFETFSTLYSVMSVLTTI